MNKRIQFIIATCAVSLLAAGAGCKKNSGVKSQTVILKEVSVPLAGNTYLTRGPQTDGITQNGIEKWRSGSDAYSVFVSINKSADVKVAIRGSVFSGQSIIQISTGGTSRKQTLEDTTFKEIFFGGFQLHKGYNQLNIKGLSTSGSGFARITDLVLKIPRESSITYVKDDKNNHFYWGRRGPSVHLAYKMPKGKDAEWFYNEITVPKGMDPIGSYFMADGFSEGYFGMQVNSKAERHILFSVWSPYKTDNPGEIPKSQRIALLRKGKGVHAGKFGNEGSGGQSYWNYLWKAGKTYKFLMHVKPNGDGRTVYTAYFKAPKLKKWKLIASFRRPKTDSWLTRPHSFLENFKAANGYKKRKAWYGNQWMRDKTGEWHQITKATFTGDNIANIGFRKDYMGGAESGRFYLQNGGFFDGHMDLNSYLKRKKSGKPPAINFSQLP